jgi:glycosyltransferase involved in cell wall biosynthesis/SAM-dependent methyltransferase
MIAVLHLAESGGWAGGETYLLALATRIDTSRFRLIVISPESGLLVDNLRARGVETLVWDMGCLGNVGLIFRLRTLLRERGISIFQTHGARSNFYGRLAGQLAGTPVIISTVHNSLYDYPVGRLRKAVYLALDRLSAPLAHCILCVAESHRRELVGRYRLPPEQVVTIPNSVDLGRFRPAESGRQVRKELGISDDAPVIGIVGRLTSQKGHGVLLRALPMLAREHPALRCLVVGDGDLRNELMGLANRLGVQDRCIFMGVRRDIPAVLSALDVLVVPSLSEGMPYVVLEGMASGKPVVATAVNGIPEVIEDRVTGRLVPRQDSGALAGAIGELLADPESAEAMGRAARRRVEEDFSMERWIGRLEALYVNLAGNVPRASDAGGLHPCPCGTAAADVRTLPYGGARLQCRWCGLLVQAEMPSDEEVNRCYRERYWEGYCAEYLSPARDNVFRHAWSWVARLRPEPGVLVDVGCGSGTLLALCREQGWKGIGFDPSAQAVACARERGLEVFEQEWLACSLPDGSADVVTFINALDHLRDPFGALQEAWRVLRPGGLLDIRVPNGPVHMWIRSALGGVGLARLAVFHLYGFGRRALLHHLPRLGFAVLGVRTAPPSLHDVYQGSGWGMSLLRKALKITGTLLYRALNGVGLNRLPWGTSIEVMASKRHANS